MTDKFNLSKKIFEGLDNNNFFLEEDVKEFILRLKEKTDFVFEAYFNCEDEMDFEEYEADKRILKQRIKTEIDNLAGKEFTTNSQQTKPNNSLRPSRFDSCSSTDFKKDKTADTHSQQKGVTETELSTPKSNLGVMMGVRPADSLTGNGDKK